MKREAPVVAKWLLRHFGSSPNNKAIIGDLDEKLHAGRSRMWYWRQAAAAIGVGVFKDIWTHKLLAVRALIVGWFIFWFLYGGLIDYGLQFFGTLTESLFKSLSSTVPPVGNGPLYCFEALTTSGVCIVGFVTGWTVARLHRRKISMVLLHASSVLLNWMILGITKNPESVGVSVTYFSMNIAILTLGILLGGIFCVPHPDATSLQHSSS